jgi:arylsulfatase A
MTGLGNRRNYTRFGHLDATQKTFGNHLRDAGYATCIVGKWQLGNGFDGPALFGFDEYCLWQLTRKPERYHGPGLEVDGREVDYPQDAYGPDVMNDYALDFIGRCQKSHRPFLLYYPMVLVHTPLEPTPDSPDGGRGRRGPDTFADMVTYADKLVGTVVEELDRRGLRENTLLIVLGDNGTARGTVTRFQGRDVAGGKGRTTSHGTRVPAIVSWPGTVPAGTVCRNLIDSTDFMPTILAAAGVEPPADTAIDGRSFLPQLRGEPGSIRDWIYSWYGPDGGETPRSEFAFDERYKLYSDGRLFDIVDDEDEQRPLSRESLEPAAARALDKLTGVLARFAGPRPEFIVRQADAGGADGARDESGAPPRKPRRGKMRRDGASVPAAQPAQSSPQR